MEVLAPCRFSFTMYGARLEVTVDAPGAVRDGSVVAFPHFHTSRPGADWECAGVHVTSWPPVPFSLGGLWLRLTYYVYPENYCFVEWCCPTGAGVGTYFSGRALALPELRGVLRRTHGEVAGKLRTDGWCSLSNYMLLARLAPEYLSSLLAFGVERNVFAPELLDVAIALKGGS